MKAMRVGLAVLAVLLGAGAAMADDLEGPVLAAHNALRAKHGVPALKWSTTLAGVAQKYADQCVFEHSDTAYGENLAQGTTGSYTPTDFVNDWYNEISGYDFKNPGESDAANHFSQVVWKSTKQVGCGLTHCGDGNDLFVCNYSPAGNFDGQYAKNVLPPK